MTGASPYGFRSWVGVPGALREAPGFYAPEQNGFSGCEDVEQKMPVGTRRGGVRLCCTGMFPKRLRWVIMPATSFFRPSHLFPDPPTCLMSLDPEFQLALTDCGFDLDAAVAERLQAYATIMWQWNEQLNLTRHTTWERFVGRDIRDCLQLSAVLDSGEEVLDLGSGNGVPGIPLAILRDDLDVSLAESVAKRAAVLGKIIADLDLPVPVYSARGEDLLGDFRFSSVVCRAVGSIAKLCRWVQPHWSNLDRLLLIKGPKWVEERGEARHLGLMQQLQLRRIASYPLAPGDEQEQGAIIQIWPQDRSLSMRVC